MFIYCMYVSTLLRICSLCIYSTYINGFWHAYVVSVRTHAYRHITYVSMYVGVQYMEEHIMLVCM